MDSHLTRREAIRLLGLTAGAAVFPQFSTEALADDRRRLRPAIDYASLDRRTAWSSHPVLGDLSFDAFGRQKGNPVIRGTPPLAWPVNGFLLLDPPSGDWFIYAGRSPRGYFLEGPASPRENMQCTVHRSRDGGRTWQALGLAFADLDSFCFDSDHVPAGLIPDVSVVYADGRYHMAFDWLSNSFTRERVEQPWRRDLCDSGIGYAWSERPEGPFRRTPEPVKRNSAPGPMEFGGKYPRLYAPTLVRRRDDWLILAMADTPAVTAWGLVGMIATDPAGPYGDPRLLLHVEDARFHPPLLEYFPAFVDEGWIYAPATSVAANRNFQVIHRVPLEEAMNPDAWTLWQHGSVWHQEPVENETCGIWGQTFAGAVDSDGRLQALFPSRDAHDCGTLNLARRDWNRPYREQGAVLSAPNGPALTCLRDDYVAFRLEARFILRGTVTFLWALTAPLGPDRIKAGAKPHALSATRNAGLTLGDGQWSLRVMNESGAATILAAGKLPAGEPRETVIECAADGALAVGCDGHELWRGTHPASRGALAVQLEQGGHFQLEKYSVSGAPLAGRRFWLCTEALLGAGQNPADWELRSSPLFRFGLGAVSRAAGGRAKWNFIGNGVALWSPRGPEFGLVEVRLDGARSATIDLHAPTACVSAELWRSPDLPEGSHTLVMQGETGGWMIDACEVRYS
jgi:hypothetical protein